MKNTPRKIVIVPSRFPFGSQEAYLTSELAELAKYFERIVVVPLRPPSPRSAQRVPDGVDVLAWPLLGASVVGMATRAFFARPHLAARTIASVLFSRDPGRIKNLAVIVKGLALAHWVTKNGFDHVHSYWLSAPATMAYIAASVSGVPWSSTAHRWDIYERNAFDVKARSASFVRTISSRGTTDVGKRMPTLNGKIIQVRLGTEVPPAPMHSPRRASTFNIVCPAALVPVKGHADILSALSILRLMGVPVSCTLAGTGPLRESLEHQVKSLSLSDVVMFAGLIPQQTLHRLYASGRFDVVVLASKNTSETEMEGLPSALIEAMAFGVPVVATDSGSVSELVDNRCGHLVPAGNPRFLADALLDVFRHPEDARNRSALAYDTVAQQHDVRIQMRAFASALAATGTKS